MIVVVDLGNSRLKWNAFTYHQGEFLYSTQVHEWNEKALATLFQNQWMHLGGEIKSIVVSNVAGKAMGNILSKWTELNINQKPHFVQSSPSFRHIKNGYDQPNTLGVDRWLAVIGAHYQFPDHNVIVVDCGTVNTVDSVSAGGQHMAGPIIPSEKIMNSALLEFTAEIFYEKQQDDELPEIVNNTQTAALQGAKLASIHGTRQAIVQLAEQLNNNSHTGKDSLKIVVTGGTAEHLLPVLNDFDVVHHPDLVLSGLSIVAKDTVKP